MPRAQGSGNGKLMAYPDPSMHTVQLHQCFERMRAGDRAAHDELLRAVCGRLERLAHQMLRSFPNVRRWADTGDVLQGALLRLLHTLERIKPGSMREFVNLAAEHIRRELLDLARHFGSAKRRGAYYAGPLPPDGVASPLVEPADSAEDPDDLEMWSRFHQEVEKLPVEEREVAGLIFYHGWAQADIAALFQVTERTIRRRWQSACLKLNEALNGRLPKA